MDTQSNSFVRLAGIDVSAYLEKKGSYTYLSWPFAVAELRKADPKASWTVQRFNGLPYLATDTGYYVEVAVTVEGVTLSQLHPVLDVKNRPISVPSAFDINTSIQRCLVKAVALHGLGLSVFAGEDLMPSEQPEPGATRQKASSVKKTPQLKQVGSGLSEPQQEQIKKLIDETGADLSRLLDFFNVESLADIRSTQYDRVIRSLEHRRAA